MPDFALDNLRERWSPYRQTVKSWGLDHFAPAEFVRLSSDWPGPDLYPPPPQLVDNLRRTAKLADTIRGKWGSPVQVVSGYRPPLYNDATVGGSESSQHVVFRALDLQPAGDFEVGAWIRHVEAIVGEYRQQCDTGVGLGRYWDGHGRFVHVDAGYYDDDRNWHRGDPP